MTKIKGVDISVYQKGISFSALQEAGVKFAIIRAGYGKKKDYTMDKFVKECYYTLAETPFCFPERLLKAYV